MNTLSTFAVLDNPWVVLIILVVTALSSWLTKRREAKEPKADKPPTPMGEPPRPAAKPREFDLEEAMRRLLGEEAFPKPQPTPPPIPHPAQEPEWEDEGPPVPPRRPMPAPPPIPVQVMVTRPAALPVEELAQETEGPRAVSLAGPEHHAAGYPRVSGRRERKWPVGQWRDRRFARQAFVASLIFGPPKGLEP